MDDQSPATDPSTRSSSDTLDDLHEQDEHVDSPMRKRPRLGSVVLRDVTIDQTLPSDSTTREVAQRPSLEETSSQHSSSNVILNLRPPKHAVSSTSPQTQNSLSARNLRLLQAHNEEEQVNDDDNPIMVTAIAGSSESHAMSSHGSPVVDIEIQDDDIFSGNDGYDSLVEVVREIPLASQKIELFPMVDQLGTEQALAFAMKIDRDPDVSFGYLQQISSWIDDVVPKTPNDNQFRPLVMKNLDFFTTLGGVFERFLNRKTPFSELGGRYHARHTKVIQRFFDSYRKLCGAMLSVDMFNLEGSAISASGPSKLISQRYIRGLNTMYNDREPAPLYLLLHNKQEVDVSRMSLFLAQSMVLDGMMFACLLRFSEIVITREHLWATESSLFPHILRTIYMVLFSMSRIPSSNFDGTLRDRVKATTESVTQLVRLIGEEVYGVIEKPAYSVDLERYKTIVEDTGRVLAIATHLNDDLARQLFDTDGLLVADIQPHIVPRLLQYTFTNKLWWKMVTKGRMELRVYGMASINEDIADIWRSERAKPEKTPSVQFMSSWMIREKVIDYIHSVESHPQLIQRSGNVWQLVAATQRWTPQMTKATWDSVAASPDVRVIAATLSCLKKVVDYEVAAGMIQHIERLMALPIEAYTLDLMTFLEQTVRRIADTVAAPHEVRNLAYDLAIRLQNDSYIADNDRNSALRDTSRRCVRTLAIRNSKLDERLRVYQLCIKHAKSKDHTYTGSLETIYYVALENIKDDMSTLLERFDILPIAALEFCNFVKSAKSASACLSNMQPLHARHRLLVFLFGYTVHYSLPEELESDLWACLMGPAVLNDITRNQGWLTLVPVVEHCQQRHNLVDRFITNILPSLPAECLSSGALTFVEHAQRYVQRIRPSSTPSDGDVITVPMADIIWKIVLTASDQDVASRAISLLSRQHLDTSFIQSATTSSVAATHIAFVEKCLEFLKSAAALVTSRTVQSPFEDPQIDLVKHLPKGDARIQFRRTLEVLTQFLYDVKRRPKFHHSPKLSNPPSPTGSIKGDPVTIRYQAFGDGTEPKIRNLRVGSLDTRSDLLSRLHAVTGFKSMLTIKDGCKIDLTHDPSEALQMMAGGGLLLVKNTGDPIEPRRGSQSDIGNSSAETAILEHFDELYRLLDSDESIAQSIYEFLVQFPPHDQIHELCLRGLSALNELFPKGKPQKTMYSLWSMKRHLRAQLNAGRLEEDYLLNCVKLLGASITVLKLLTSSLKTPGQRAISFHLASCYQAFLHEHAPPSISAQFFDVENAPVIVEELCNGLDSLMSVHSSGDAEIVEVIYTTITEASLHSQLVWNAFKARRNIDEIHQKLILDIPDASVREHVASCMTVACKSTDSDNIAQADAFASFYWEVTSKLIIRASTMPQHSKQLFAAASSVFTLASRQAPDEAQIRSYLASWTELLSDYIHTEVPGREEADDFLFGMINLLTACVMLLKGFKRSLDAGMLPDTLYDRFLFPQIGEESEVNTERLVPVLDFECRTAMHKLVVLLVEHDTSFERLIGKMKTLAEPKSLPEIPWNSDRTKLLRSPAGQLGLRNLTNTCYMNSLLTQLYMNGGFRSFLLDSNVADAGGSQKLLGEMQALFAHMQGSRGKYADTSKFAGAVVPYDAQHIDVSIQMDVDEFFNLLFDRLEGQMLTAEAKQGFRSIFGGQLVTQIKSKDCIHVSERFEPFLAVQCDIQGKANLTESLKSYVEGDVMEGDNKYKCESCGGRFVDAVKRSCFKDIPDNLIFHLKRFDFDLQTLQRNKINDHFDFPTTIDMSQFSVDHLTDPDAPIEQDNFELVGILVHTGTAETGHYYSYIRAGDGENATWLEFNDTEVTEFDSAKIADACFGGDTRSGEYQWSKPYSAYMLFFRRVPKMEMNIVAAQKPSLVTDSTMQMHDQIQKEISDDNDLLVRRYCLLSPSHAGFVRSLLGVMVNDKEAVCSADHGTEKMVLTMVLDHVEQVISRAKDAPELESTLAVVKKAVFGCVECCTLVMDWALDRLMVVANMLLVNPTEKARTLFGDFLYSIMAQIREKDMGAWGIDTADENAIDISSEYAAGVLPGMITSFGDYMTPLWKNCRQWDQYFILWARIAAMGLPEIALLLQSGIFRSCVEIVTALDQVRSPRSHDMDEVLDRIVNMKRPPSFTEPAKFVSLFFKHLDVYAPPCSNYDEQRHWAYHEQTLRFTLTELEQEMIIFWDTKLKRLHFLARFIDIFGEVGASWPPELILKAMLGSNPRPDKQDTQKIALTIVKDLNEYFADYIEPVLCAARIYCIASPELDNAPQIIKTVANSVEALPTVFRPQRRKSGPLEEAEVKGGRVHVAFFRDLAFADDVRSALSPEIRPFLQYVIHHFCMCAPILLLHEERIVRQDAFEGLSLIIFNHFPHDAHALDDDKEMDLAARRTIDVRSLFTRCKPRLEEGWNLQFPRSNFDQLIMTMNSCAKWLNELQKIGDSMVVDKLVRGSEDNRIMRDWSTISSKLSQWPEGDGDDAQTDTEYVSPLDDDSDEDLPDLGEAFYER